MTKGLHMWALFFFMDWMGCVFGLFFWAFCGSHSISDIIFFFCGGSPMYCSNFELRACIVFSGLWVPLWDHVLYGQSIESVSININLQIFQAIRTLDLQCLSWNLLTREIGQRLDRRTIHRNKMTNVQKKKKQNVRCTWRRRREQKARQMTRWGILHTVIT